MRITVLVVLAGLFWFLGTEELSGHGGKIGGGCLPPPGPPPDPAPTWPQPEPGPVTGGKPVIKPGPSTPGPNGGRPVTSPGGVRGPMTPAAPAGPATMMGKKNKGVMSTDVWDLWWAYNREPYLLLRTPAESRPRSGATGFLLGMGHEERAAEWNRPGRKQLLATIIPALKAGVDSGERRIADSAILALGKVTPAEDAEMVAKDLKAMLANPSFSVRQAAILGLSLLGDRSSVPPIWEIMNDTAAGRTMTGAMGAVQQHDRAVAALALGFSCGSRMVPQLCRLIDRRSDDDVELVASAVLSLGLVRDATTEIVPFLASLLENERLDPRIRAQAPISLARFGEEAAATLPTLLKLVRDRKQPREVRLSAMIAIGGLATAADQQVIEAVRRVISRENDAQLRHLAIMSLGRIGARARADEEILRFLLSEIVDPRHKIDLPWAVLAAGVAGYGRESSSKERQVVADRILSLMKRTSNPSNEGAMALALGLLRADDAGPHLLTRLKKSSNAQLRSYLALGLGLMNFRPALEPLRELVLDEKDPQLRVEAATALGLMGDGSAAGELVAMLGDSPTYAETISIARALGQIGDRRVVGRLAAYVTDTKQPIAVRSYSCVALGLIAEETEMPWNTPLAVDSNYLIGLQTQHEILNLF